MENKKRQSFDDPSVAASALRRLTRSPTGHRLSLRRSSTTSSSATSVTSVIEDEPPTSCVSRNTSSEECALYRFIVWAAVKRNACQKMTPEEKRECPLLRCRKRFANHELMLQHLYACDHLAGGEYWCYDCEKPEQLNDAKCKRCLGHPSKRRKIMSMAKNFFSSLGHKPKTHGLTTSGTADLDAEEEPPSYDSVFTPPQVELYSNEIHEIGSSDVLLPTIPECENETAMEIPTGMLTGLNPSFPITPATRYETEAQAVSLEPEFINWSSPTPTVEPQYLMKPSPGRLGDRPSLQLHTHGLDQYRPPAKRRSKTLAPSSSVRSTSSTDSTESTNSTASYNISPMSGWSGGWTKASGLESALTSPDDLVSPGGCFFPANNFAASYRPMPFSESELDNVVANSCPSELPADIPMFDLLSMDQLQDTLNLDQPAFSFDPSVPVQVSMQVSMEPNMTLPDNLIAAPPQATHTQLTPQTTGGSLVNVQSLVGSAHDALKMHIADSMTKLNDIKKNHLVGEFCGMSPSSVALEGLETMADILEGRQPTSPVKLLCFIHVVFSLSLVVHEQDAPTRCAGLFNQAMSYSAWFSDHDREAYIEVVYVLWKPNEVSDDDIINLLRVEATRPVTTSASRKGKEPEHSLQELRSDPLVFVAQYFLDELNYSALHDVSQPEVQASELATQDLRYGLGAGDNSPFALAAKFMIEGLSRKHGDAPGFVSSMKGVIDQVNSGYVSTVRRLELELLQAGKMHLSSSAFFDSFIEEVRKQADSLYTQDVAYFSPRSTYHRYSAKLMQSLIEGSKHSRTGAANVLSTAPASGAVEPNLEDFDFDAVISFNPEQDIHSTPPSQEIAVNASFIGEGGWKHAPIPGIPSSLAGQPGAGMTALAAAPEAPSMTDIERPKQTTAKLSRSNKAEPSSSTIVESDSCCKLCSYRPKGDPRWFVGSMAKHMRTIHSDTPKIFRCPYPGCTSQYSKRADNLRQHQIEKGHFVDGQGIHNRRPRKRKRATTTTE